MLMKSSVPLQEFVILGKPQVKENLSFAQNFLEILDKYCSFILFAKKGKK